MLFAHVPRVVKLKMGKEKKKVTLTRKSTLSLIRYGLWF